MGIYDIFAAAARTVEKIPGRTRLLAGVTAGAVYQGFSGDPDQDIFTRIGKGMFIGGVAGLGVSAAMRGVGIAAAGGERIGRAAITSKIAQYQKVGWKTLMKPGTLAIGGALAGAAIAPTGYKSQGALLGAGLGFVARPAMSMYKGFEALGKVPGAQTGAMIAIASIPVAAAGAFGHKTPDTEAMATPAVGGTMDYTPLEGGMKDRMTALNASGDIVLGLHGRQHG
jgi:hypothetical protein